MKAQIIQFVLALIGICFLIAHQPVISSCYTVGAFVVWALKRDGA